MKTDLMLAQLADFLPDYRAVTRAMLGDHGLFAGAVFDALGDYEEGQWAYDLMYWLRRTTLDHLIFKADDRHKIRRFDSIQECLTLGFERMAQEAIGDWIVEHDRLPLQLKDGSDFNPWMTVEEKEGEVV